MEKISAKQDVILFDHDNQKGLQEASVDPKDNWIWIFHDGQEMSMKIENWNKLVALADSVISKTG